MARRAGALDARGCAQPPAPDLNDGRSAAPLRPHQLRHAHAVEMAREGVSLKVIQRQLGHVNLGVTSGYLDGIDTAEIIDTVHNRRAPMISASAGLSI
jgi:site-specific recombinase XerD